VRVRTSRLHLLLLALQVALVYPAFAWWKDAVWFVIALSLYANISTEFGNWEAARAKELAQAKGAAA
jgi:hypothetical protein